MTDGKPDTAGYWRRLSEGEVTGWIMPLDATIGDLRRRGLSLGAIARQISRHRSYVQQRLLRIAAREEIVDHE